MTQWMKRMLELDAALRTWMGRHGVGLLRLSLGVVFFWFGVLKFFPGVSPAQGLATRTISVLTFGMIPPETSIVILAAWECLIGIGLLSGKLTRVVLLLMWLQMAGTVTPLILFPGEAFAMVPLVPTMEGQYIIKNIVLVSAGVAVGSAVGRPAGR